MLRSLAAVLAVLGVAPLWRTLEDPATGLAGAATASYASTTSSLLWSGLVLCFVPGVLAAMFVDRATMDRWEVRVAALFERPRTTTFAPAIAVLATLIAVISAQLVLDGMPRLIDSFAQLLHARYLANGRLSGPVSSDAAFWHIQQTVLTPNGWVSQYPPGHVVLLALGLKLNAAWLIGPLCWGVAVLFTTLALHELIENLAVARAAALLAALSPFGWVLSGAFMSHIPAAACASVALYCVPRGRHRGWGYALGAGVALGALFTLRPLTAVALGAAAAVFAVTQRRASAIAIALIGALPFLLVIAWYNEHFFGSALRFGYHAALGDNAGLGFGIDPWGNRYGLLQALAYATAELVTLSLQLFEAPLPLVLLIGSYFLSGRRAAGEWLLFAWCAVPLFAGLFYWHHGLFMGPRMLADVAPQWAALSIISALGLIRGLRSDWVIARNYSPRTFATATTLGAVVFGVVMLLPQRLSGYQITRETRALLEAPHVEQPALVFVHGGWTARIGMMLAAHGMRLDEVETALRQNPTCIVQAFADSFSNGNKAALQLDMTPRAVDLPAVVQISPGNRMRVAQGEPLTPECEAQVKADEAGVIDVTPYIWQGDLPGGEARGALFVRDLGPSANRALIAQHPDRRALMLVPHADTVALVPYAIAERAIWQGVE